MVKVAIKVASSLLPKSTPTLNISKILVPEALDLISNLSDVRSSVVPSALIKEYLSSSNGKNVSLAPAVTTEVREFVAWAIVTSKDFLIVIVAEVKSKSAINFLGAVVYNVLSVEVVYSDLSIFKSERLVGFLVPVAVGNCPTATPETVVIPVTLISEVPTVVTLA